MSDKSTWEHFGAENPYYGVATYDHFRGTSLDPKKLDQFFETGKSYVDEVWNEIEKHFMSNFHPESAMDFGCGVGRLAIPLADKCGKVLGIDISSTMIREAQKNADDRNLSNIEFKEINGDLADLSMEFDFVHSFIVLQHINPSLGERLFEQIVRSLKPDGIGALHITYYRPGSLRDKLKTQLASKLPFLNKLVKRMRNRRFEPVMPMHCYDLGSIFRILHENECHGCFTRPTFHGMYGLLIIFQKKENLLQ